MNELHKETLEKFWTIYDTEGTVQALSWLESLKYYEEFCCDDVSKLSSQLSNFSLQNTNIMNK